MWVQINNFQFQNLPLKRWNVDCDISSNSALPRLLCNQSDFQNWTANWNENLEEKKNHERSNEMCERSSVLRCWKRHFERIISQIGGEVQEKAKGDQRRHEKRRHQLHTKNIHHSTPKLNLSRCYFVQFLRRIAFES